MNDALLFRRRCLALALTAILPASLAIGVPRASNHYSIDAETMDAGGLRARSLNYGYSGSAGSIAGISSSVAPEVIAKSGFLGQIADVVGLQLTAPGLSINEGGSLQLSAACLLDDVTTVPLMANTVSWSIVGGPLLSVGSGGLVNADVVFENAEATVGGAHLGNSKTLKLTVVNVGRDDFGSYAGDALDDQWQVQYFGLENPDAAPGLDPDGDGQSNAFEFLTGVAPNDPASAFQLRIEAVPEQPAQRNLVFSPRLPDRSYALEFVVDLVLGPWMPLAGAAQIDNGPERTMTDLDASGGMKYYRVRITKP